MKVVDYRIRTGETLDELERRVKELINGGYIPIGDALSYYDEKKSRQVFYQAMIQEKIKI
jgi:hypothetical protein